MEKYRYAGLAPARRIPNNRYAEPLPVIQDAEAGTDLTVPAHGTYGGLLFDPRWKSKRAQILQRDGACCIICRSPDELQVHHRQYQFIRQANSFKMPWDYPDDLLITLCKNCHTRGHSKFKIPILIIA